MERLIRNLVLRHDLVSSVLPRKAAAAYWEKRHQWQPPTS